MLVKDLLGGKVDTCTPDLGTTEAARRMIEEDMGSLAVVDKDGSLVGIVTERDVMRAVAEGKSIARSSVGDIMTPRPDSLEPEVDIEDAAAWIMGAGYRHLPVTTEGRLIGMVSIKDLVWALTESRSGNGGLT